MDNILEKLTEILEKRRNADPSTSYVASLHAKGINKILEKVGEEAEERPVFAVPAPLKRFLVAQKCAASTN